MGDGREDGKERKQEAKEEREEDKGAEPSHFSECSDPSGVTSTQKCLRVKKPMLHICRQPC